MTKHVRSIPVVICVLIFCSLPAFAQTPGRRSSTSTAQARESSPDISPNADSNNVVANEIELLRKSLDTLNVRLREISEKVPASDSNPGGSPNDKQTRIALGLDLLTRAEQRAELLRKQLLELIEKETTLNGRLVQLEEDIRPENIERSMSLTGTTRTAELRETRRKVLETERKGTESLLELTTQGRDRLEDDVRRADAMVSRLRQRLLPLIEKEIENININ